MKPPAKEQLLVECTLKENKRLRSRSPAKYFSPESKKWSCVQWMNSKPSDELGDHSTDQKCKNIHCVKHQLFAESLLAGTNFLEARRIRFNLPKAAQNYFNHVSIHSFQLYNILLNFFSNLGSMSHCWGALPSFGG